MLFDKINIKLRTNWMKKAVSKWLTKQLVKSLGCEATLDLGDLDIESIDGETIVHADIRLMFNNEDLMKALKQSSKEEN